MPVVELIIEHGGRFSDMAIEALRPRYQVWTKYAAAVCQWIE
jgi:hypothetical protein